MRRALGWATITALISLAATAQAATPTLSLTPDASCYTAPGATVTVNIEFTQSATEDEILGGQFFLEYDQSKLTFVSVTTGASPFTRQVYVDTNTAGQIDYAVGIPNGSSGYSGTGPITMATITFTAASEDCSATDAVSFRDTSGDPYDTRLTRRVGSTSSEPLAVSTMNDLSAITLDWTGPEIGGVPLSVTLDCDESVPAATYSEAWGLYASSGDVSSAVRPFSSALTTGDVFQVNMDNGWLDNGSTVGLGLQNASGDNRFELYFVGGESAYTILDSSGTVNTGLGFTDEGLLVVFTVTGADTYSVTVHRLEDSSVFTHSGTLSNSGSIERFRAFNASAGSGSSNDAYFNNLAINNTAFDRAGEPAYDDSWATGDNGGTGFGSWTLAVTGASSGWFVASSAGNGDGDANSDGDIDGVTAGDTCSSATLAYSETSDLGGCNGTGSITRTWTATDTCGNQSVATQTITVQDVTGPTVTAPTAVELECSSGLPAAATTIAEFLALTGADASDNCTAQANLTVTSSTGALGGDECSGTITRTYTISDACGNTTDVDHVFNVSDDTAPTATAPTAVELECSTGLPAAATTIAEFLALTGADANDNCTVQASLTVASSTGALVGDECTGTITRTYTIADACGNTVDVDHVFNVSDDTAPTATAPTAVELECSTGLPAAATTIAEFLALAGADANDNCTAQASLTVTSSTGALIGDECAGTITRTYTIADACGNTVDVDHVFNVSDDTAPTATAPTAVELECSASLPAAATTIAEFLALTGADVSDNCTAQASLTVTSSTGALVGDECTATITRTYTIADACGNTVDVDHVFNVSDDTAPTATAPTAVELECSTSLPAAATTIAEFLALTGTDASDNCTAQASLTVTSSTGALVGDECTGTITRTYTIADACGNTVDVDHVFNISDDTAPIATAPTNVTIECAADVPASITTHAAYIAAGGTASDNCSSDGDLVITSSDVSDNQTCPETITRTYTIMDDCGNSTQAVQTIVVDDTTSPQFDTFPSNVTLECDQSTDPANTGTPTGSDNCDATPTITYSDVTDAGVITRTWTIEDDCGNYVEQDQTITIADTTDPVITVPADITIECDESTAPANTGQATATDNCDADPDISYVDSTAAGACDNEYTITRTWTAMDNAGNTDSDTQTITVVDTTAPTFAEAAGALDLTIECSDSSDPANTGQPTPSDTCGMATVDPLTYSDAESLGGCNGTGTITRTWTATDACDNTATYVQIITVIDTIAPTIAEAAGALDITIECDASSDPANTGEPTPSDGCGMATIDPLTYSDSVAAGSCPEGSVITRTWTATDACGNSATYVQTITVVDTTAPTFTVPADITLNADAGDCTASLTLAEIGEPTAVADNCADSGDLTVTWSRSDSATNLDDPFPQGTTTITWTVSDQCSNESSQDQIVTVAAYNDVVVDIEIQDLAAAVTRCVTFTFVDCATSTTEVITQDIAFDGSGQALDVLITDLPCGSYDCVTAEDELHTLQVRLDAAPQFDIVDGQYVLDFTNQGAGADYSLITADYFNDELIDIADFGVFIAQWGANYDSNEDTIVDGSTPCGVTWAPDGLHADASGDGVLDVSDFNPISANFLSIGDDDCCVRALGSEPRESILVNELAGAGVRNAWRADFNNDGVIDMTDVELFLAGATPPALNRAQSGTSSISRRSSGATEAPRLVP